MSRGDRQKIVGVCPAARGAVLAEVMRSHPSPVWVVVEADLKAAEQLAEDASFFASARHGGAGLEVLVFPESIPDSRDMREAFAASGDRLTVLSRLREALLRKGWVSDGPSLAVIATPTSLLQPVPAIEQYAASEIVLVRGAKQPFQELLERLRSLDYDSEAVCESPGHYAIRGGIIDVYPVTAPEPYRLDFFGDEIEDIRAFDPVTQRSGARVERISVAVSPRVRLESAKTGISDYLHPLAHVAFMEPAALEEEFRAFADEGTDPLAPLLAKCAEAYGIADIDEASTIFAEPQSETVWDTEGMEHHRRYPSEGLLARERLHAEDDARRDFLAQVARWGREGYAVAFAASKDGEEKRIREILGADPALSGIKPVFLRGSLNEGFRQTARPGATLGLGAGLGLVFVTETEIFGRKRTRRAGGTRRAGASVAQVDQLLDFSELVEGDFVVHLQHGIAVYRGVTKIDTAQGLREVISVEFDDGVTLHVPLQESHLISRYVGLGRTKPQLGRIGTGRWEKARRAVERATVDLAAELLRVQASREAQPGFAFPEDTEWQREFEASFPFTETPGQMRAIEETKGDMERKRPMDRLICGDVGFGKTEVALRAAFKAVQAGKQVIVLVPTTVLAQQHLNTFRERMAAYPVAIEMVSRFRSPPEQRTILRALAAGGVDILIGTHRLLQKDVVPKDQGGLQGHEGHGRRPFDERDADPADALSRAHQRTRHERHRHPADEPAPDPDHRQELRRQGRGRRHPARDAPGRPSILPAQPGRDDRPCRCAPEGAHARALLRRRPRQDARGGPRESDDGFCRREVQSPRLHDHHRKRPGHTQLQHADHRGGGPLRPFPALPAEGAGWPVQAPGLRLPPAAQPHAPHGRRPPAHEYLAPAHAAWRRFQDSDARP
jgi:transcription-repair coupling factor (superfamily II helicase)